MRNARTWKAFCLLAAGLAMVVSGPTVMAQQNMAEMQTSIDALKNRLRQQSNRLNELEDQYNQAWLQDLKESVDEARVEAPAVPDWLDNLEFSGDLRLRYQADCYNGQAKDRHRARFRLRFGVKKYLMDDQWEIGFRLASGSSSDPNGSDPTSTNQSFDDFFSEKNIWIDRAYAKYTPKAVKGLVLVGGKMANPLVHTNMIWDSDVNPEGVWGQYSRPVSKAFTPFANVGYFIVEEEFSGHDVTLATYQAGFNAQTDWLDYTLAATWYDFDDLEGNFSTANGNHTMGGRLLAEEFQMINVVNKFSFDVMNWPVGCYFDWVYNCGDTDPVENFEDQNAGFAVGVEVGENAEAGDVSFGYKYAYIQSNATPGFISDSDFNYVNRKGHVIEGAYSLAKSAKVALALFYTQPVVGVGGTRAHETETTVQADFIWDF